MSMPSDVNPDVAEAVEALEERMPPRVRSAGNSLFRKVSTEQYGFAAAVFVAFLGVAVCGPKVREMRKPRRQRMIERARRAARDATEKARRQARDVREDAERRLHRLSGSVTRR